MSLVPTECWDFNLADTVRGLRTALSVRHSGADPRIPIPGLGSSMPVRSARAGIVVALRALSLRRGANVAVPLYCCPVVLSAIKAAGCRARFIDVDPDTYCLSPADLAAKSSEVDCVIAVHMFGNVCDMSALRKAAPGKPIIEDCAQALGSHLDGKVAGSFGEIAVFSFRSGKYISAGEGGSVYCNQKAIESRVLELISELAVPSSVEECVHVVKTYLRSQLRRQPLWGLVGAPLWSAYNENVSFTSQAPIVLTQVYATDRETTIRRLSLLDSFIERQRSNASYYSRNLTVDNGMLCWEPQGAFFNRQQYPLLLPSYEQCEQMAAYLRSKQISTTTPYKNIGAIATIHHGYDGDCPRSEQISRTVLMIPCNYALTTAELEHIAESVNHGWAEIDDHRRTVGVHSIPGSAIADRQNREG
jgi:dTDP-4-amino-4,6-dideoxygalactose transaminase